VNLSNSASASVTVGSFCITRFIAWKESNILLVASMILLYASAGKGPDNSNSLVAALRRLCKRTTVLKLVVTNAREEFEVTYCKLEAQTPH